jgi:hypothetical protein
MLTEIRKTRYGKTSIRYDSARRPAILSDRDLRKLVAWLSENNPEIIRDIICDKCPEVK